MYLFKRKARFYERRYDRKADRLIVISPMVDRRVEKLAKGLGIEIYSDSLEVRRNLMTQCSNTEMPIIWESFFPQMNANRRKSVAKGHVIFICPQTMNEISIYEWDELEPLAPAYALVADVDEEQLSVLYGRCLHRSALMYDEHIDGDNLICGLHNSVKNA